MPYLIFKREPSKDLLEIVLQGTVPPKLVKEIQVRLMGYKSRFKAIAPMIPMLRVEKGYWCFKSQIPPIHHGQVIVECFIEAIETSGFKPLDRFDVTNKFAPPHSTLFKSEEKGLEHSMPPGVNEEFGGDFKEVKMNPISSVELKPESSVPIAGICEASEGQAVFGVGWGQTPDKTSKMLGLPSHVDIDLILYICNKYGEVITLLSPKGRRRLDKRGRTGVNVYGGVQVSIDSKRGDKEWDDERFVFEPRRLPPFVHSVVICLQIQSGARSFREVFDVHLRLLDTSVPGIENEHCAFHLDSTRDNLKNKGTCAIMGRIIRDEGKGFIFQSIGNVCRVAEQSLKIGNFPNLPSHVTLKDFKVNIPATDAKGMIKQNAQGLTDPYVKVFIEYWVKASKLPTTAQMKGHWKKSHHGLVLKQGGRTGDVIVKHVVEGTPAQVAGFQEGDLILEMNRIKIKNSQGAANYLNGLDHKTPVGFLVYRAPEWLHLNMRIGRPIERKRNVLWQSAVQRRVPCPASVTFPDSKEIKVDVASMTGHMKDRNTLCLVNRYGLVVVECYDSDRMSRDDKIFRHEINMDQLFDEDMDTDSDWFRTTTQKPVDYSITSNGPFTHCQVYFFAQRFK